MLDFQGDDATAAEVAAYKAKGVKTVCYIDLGTYEPGRSDLNLIPAKDIGGAVQGWPGEKWLNVADIAGLTPLIQERLQMCATKGFDGVEVDNVDGYSNTTGFSISAAQQLAYNENYAAVAHSLGLSIGLKNDIDQVTTLQPYFDWSLNEQCNQYSECGALSSFTSNGKAVFNAEYSGGTGFCAADVSAHINGGAFALDLSGSGHTACPGSW